MAQLTRKKQQLLKNEQVQDVDFAINRVKDNRSDYIENTFCYQLFENNFFDKELFEFLVQNINISLNNAWRDERNTILWIYQSVIRCVFSHYDDNDLYQISNFDCSTSAFWYDHALDELNNILHRYIEHKNIDF